MMWAFSLTMKPRARGEEAAVPEAVHLLEQDGRIDDDAVADHADLAGVEDAGRDEMQDGLLALDDQGVAGIVAPLEPDDDIGVLRVKIDNFSLSLRHPTGFPQQPRLPYRYLSQQNVIREDAGSLHFQFGDRDHVRQFPEFFDHIRGGDAVGAQDDHRLAVDLFAAQMEPRDVDAALRRGSCRCCR